MKHSERDDVPMSARNLRLDASLTQAEVAARMGSTVSQVCRIERRYQRPSASTMVQFLKAVDRIDLAHRVQLASLALQAVRQGREPQTKALADYFDATHQSDLADLMRAVSR